MALATTGTTIAVRRRPTATMATRHSSCSETEAYCNHACKIKSENVFFHINVFAAQID